MPASSWRRRDPATCWTACFSFGQSFGADRKIRSRCTIAQSTTRILRAACGHIFCINASERARACSLSIPDEWVSWCDSTQCHRRAADRWSGGWYYTS